MNYQVFISHSTRNAEIASAMKSFLESQGIKCWKAPEDIPAGMEWDTGIVKGLKECSIIVLIFSKDADGSTNVKKELALGDNFKKIIVPFRIENDLPDNLAYFLCMPQWLDAFEGIEAGFNQLSARLKALLPALEVIEEAGEVDVDSGGENAEELGDIAYIETEGDEQTDSNDTLIITEPAVIIRISSTYRPGMSDEELKTAALGDWSISLEKAKQAKLAYVATKGNVVAVYDLTTCRETDSLNKAGKKRIRFEGTFSQQKSGDLGKSIRHYFRRGDANPVRYLNIGAVESREQKVLNSAKQKDTTKYTFNGASLGKGRLVLEVMRKHCADHPSMTYTELEAAFPQSLQGSGGVFAREDDAQKIFSDTGRKRHFLNEDEMIQISDATIAVSSQWGAGNIDKFIDKARTNGHVIEATS